MGRLLAWIWHLIAITCSLQLPQLAPFPPTNKPTDPLPPNQPIPSRPTNQGVSKLGALIQASAVSSYLYGRKGRASWMGGTCTRWGGR